MISSNSFPKIKWYFIIIYPIFSPLELYYRPKHG
uniref:Uncharacterized protein n=1 Tax=Rhizophora mucronata TaxID=61149 RepID=A0A2P2PDY3_RHIMU